MFKLSYVLLVFIGGGMGAAGRYLATALIGARFGSTFPFGTLAVNVAGSFLMGFLMAVAMWQHTTLPEPVRLLCAVGFLGGFTTFSSFSMETMTLLSGGYYWTSTSTGSYVYRVFHTAAKVTTTVSTGYRYAGNSVRLVHDAD